MANGTGVWCTTATGACSQRPIQGGATTRTSAPSRAGKADKRASKSCAPASPQLSPSHTRIVRPVAAVALCRSGTNQRTHFFQRGVVGLAALELAFAADALAQLVHRGEHESRCMGMRA